jgi:hypothetical protein
MATQSAGPLLYYSGSRRPAEARGWEPPTTERVKALGPVDLVLDTAGGACDIMASASRGHAPLLYWENPRLCRGGSQSLTFPGFVYARPRLRLHLGVTLRSRSLQVERTQRPHWGQERLWPGGSCSSRVRRAARHQVPLRGSRSKAPGFAGDLYSQEKKVLRSSWSRLPSREPRRGSVVGAPPSRGARSSGRPAWRAPPPGRLEGRGWRSRRTRPPGGRHGRRNGAVSAT